MSVSYTIVILSASSYLIRAVKAKGGVGGGFASPIGAGGIAGAVLGAAILFCMSCNDKTTIALTNFVTISRNTSCVLVLAVQGEGPKERHPTTHSWSTKLGTKD